MTGELLGGRDSNARRLGRVVQRGPTPDFAAQVLRHLKRSSWPHAPTLIARNAEGSVLSYVDGTAATTRLLRHEAAEDDPLAAVAALVRQYHDLMAGTDLAGDAETVCHNDLDPSNTVYRWIGQRLVPVALVDWDMAAPGSRITDLAQMCWAFTGVGPRADPEIVRHRIGVITAAYGWECGLDEVVEVMLARQQDAADVSTGALSAAENEADRRWTLRHLR